MKNLKTKIALVISSVLMPVVALAQSVPTKPPKVVTDFAGIIAIIQRVSNWFFSILIALAVIFLLYAAFLYLQARGAEADIEKAKNVIIYAIWAIAIAVLAAGVPSLICSFFEASCPA
jgi:hypothetical protein